ncbi:M16 family metallopeptidase [Aestuariispira insulae]|uniref:Putative Zn-dependent peptidase n=1 Tax=Aestuariispira insulae TaxID=1461337 RepID=A0A3D9HGP7_9PROT|nr:pitrilysin family protein [Aestuariispira insulae]RED48640.1 putative Zn-dependent peptidase [Aestuariispira insulae]
MTQVRTSTLSNGLRVITDRMDSVESVCIGVWVGTGSRAETAPINGTAHFLEHMAFKGTTRRSALDIAMEVEAVGGHFNAYTSRENTAYYMKVLRGDVGLAVDILGDILQNPSFIEAEFERERGVILQEIGQSLDTPDDIIFDYFQETAFPDQAIGRPILGTAPLIRDFQRQTLIDFMKARYQARNMVLVASGAVDHDMIVAQAEEAFANLTNDPVPEIDKGRYQGGDFRKERDCEQVHLLLGFDGVTYGGPDHFDAHMLSTLLGDGMSSRLFQEVREKRGLVYSIYSFSSAFSDCGLFGIYAGTGEEEVRELIPVVCDVLSSLPEDLTEEEISRARAQLKSSLLMGLESTSGRADQLGTQMLSYGRALSMDEIITKIDACTRDSVASLAGRLFRGTPTLAATGPLSHLESHDQLTARL